MKLLKLFLLVIILIMPACSSAAGGGTTPAVEPTRPPSQGEPSPEVTSGPPPPVESTMSPEAQPHLANTRWVLVSFGAPGAETPVIAGSKITLEFGADGQAGGSGGCNTYGGTYQVQDKTLSFSQIVSTLMACADARVTQQEQQYLEALQSAGQFEQTDNRLTIQYDNGQGVLNFSQA